MAAKCWSEVEQVRQSSRRELVLTGNGISKRLEKESIDPSIFSLHMLNFLEFSRTDIKEFPDELGNLVNLTNLVLSGNKLAACPSTIGKLTKLKFLDLSQNELKSLPAEVNNLSELQSLLIFSNLLSKLPNMDTMTNLHIVNASNNSLTEFPNELASKDMVHLLELDLHSNQLTALPSDIQHLSSLKKLDVSNNHLETLPFELSECMKLKDFAGTGNRLKDKRLDRMMTQCHTKSVLEYLRKEMGKQQSAGGGKSKGKKERKKEKKVEESVTELQRNIISVKHFPENGLTIKMDDSVVPIRPYIVACIVRNVDLNKTKNMFKRFINLQTKLHDTVCQMRQVATIATHDYKSIHGPLLYVAKPPPEINLVPLFKHKETTAEKLVGQLRQEAEEFRKEKKRNTLSGIHKYLDLLKGKPAYACLVDKLDKVISLPPITNCDITKISTETTDILIEVTSSQNLEKCKRIADQIIEEMVELDLNSEETATSGSEDEQEPEEDGAVAFRVKRLTVEQVKVTDIEGQLKVVYPSRTDLLNDKYQILREK